MPAASYLDPSTGFMAPFLKQQLLFVLGKGGVGRSTVSAAIAHHCSQHLGEKVLLVQWGLSDTVSPIFGAEPAGHKHREILPGFSVMNYDPDEALREYFVDHLNMGVFFHVVLENAQVQRLIRAAPGLAELLFLGRLFWLMELSHAERGYSFDRIVVDAPATGHGSALFGVVATISRFKLTGPLISEATRVSKLLADADRVGTIVVSLPEELPVEETLEMIPRLTEETGRPPLCVILNRSLQSLLREDAVVSSPEDSPALAAAGPARQSALPIYVDLLHRLDQERRLRDETRLPVLGLPDLMISQPHTDDATRLQRLSEALA